MVADSGGEHRPGQEDMCAAVASALRRRHHLIVEAPTGIGKSYAIAVAVADWLVARRDDGTSASAERRTRLPNGCGRWHRRS